MDDTEFGVRRFGRVNWLGLKTLAEREIRRFLAIWMQTVLAPLVTAILFLMIFSLAIGSRRGEVMGLPFTTFLVPGIMMMTVIQNAFANTSSSLMAAKVQGNIVDTLMPPLSGTELTLGYLSGGVARALSIAVATVVVMALGMGLVPAHPLVTLVFVILGAVLLGAFGLVAAMFAAKMDQVAAISNFVITPLAFLSGTFYSVDVLPPVLRVIAHVNPIFYLIDGARFGLVGVSDSSPWIGAAVCTISAAAAVAVVRWMLTTGYRLKP